MKQNTSPDIKNWYETDDKTDKEKRNLIYESPTSTAGTLQNPPLSCRTILHSDVPRLKRVSNKFP